ncbi:ATP-dependent sacrificial sulfur transferase LarE [bacterium]|nr:ATP-dependent sacrificial sulfur transferase LarE [bacterium]
MNKKLQQLKKILTEMGSVLIAYSGGVDSVFLLKIANDVLSDDKVMAVTASSFIYPACEMKEAETIAKKINVKHLVIKTDELSNQKFAENSVDRCYWCKRNLFSKLAALAKKYKLNYVLDGSNYDDTKDFRPGRKAVEELGVRSPLEETCFTKDEIRSLSERLGLPTWNKPSLACLASRFPYGMRITKENLAKVDQAESFLRGFGITQVRVRHHDQIARIEVLKDEISKLLKEDVRDKIVTKFKELGYTYVTIDLEGYRTGSMNEKNIS